VNVADSIDDSFTELAKRRTLAAIAQGRQVNFREVHECCGFPLGDAPPVVSGRADSLYDSLWA
jgi:hypothetical protein